MTGPIFPPMTERPEEVWVDVPRKFYVAMPQGMIEMSEPQSQESFTPNRLPTVYDGVLHNWPEIKDGSKSYPFFAIARKHGVGYAAVLAQADFVHLWATKGGLCANGPEYELILERMSGLPTKVKFEVEDAYRDLNRG